MDGIVRVTVTSQPPAEAGAALPHLELFGERISGGISFTVRGMAVAAIALGNPRVNSPHFQFHIIGIQ